MEVDETFRGMFVWVIDDEGKGHNIPLRGDQLGRVLVSIIEPEGGVDVNPRALSYLKDSILIKKTAPLAYKMFDNETILGNRATKTYIVDLTDYNLLAILVKLGTKTGNPTVTVRLRFQDSNGNIIEDSDYPSVTYSNATASVSHKLYLEAYTTAYIDVYMGGTESDNFANCTIEVQAKAA